MSAFPALQPTYAPYPFPVVRGVGDRIFDAEGNAYWDFYGGHCVCSTGHSHPKVVKAITDQAAEILFYSTAAQIPVRDAAAQALIDFVNLGLESPMASVFFCNSGAEANENALKIAAKQTGRKAYASFKGGWHGRSILAISVTDDVKLTPGLESFLVPDTQLPFGDEEALEKADLSQCAAIILEPIQSMAGITTAPASFFKALRKKCDESGCYLIFDEVQTGVGRMGKPYAANYYGVTPDLITSAKGIASGVPMGAVIFSPKVASLIKGGDLGSTFGGGPLASAALLATLQVIQEEGLMDRATAIAERLRRELVGTVVSKVEGEGLLLGLRAPGCAASLKKFLQAEKILVGGSSDPEVLRLLPPLNLSDAAVDALLGAIKSFKN